MDKPLVPLASGPQWRAYLSFLGGCMINFATGSINAFGTFSVYFTSYYYAHDPDNSFVADAFFIVFPIANALEGICFAIGTLLYFRLGIRLTQLIGGGFYVGAFLAGGFLQNPYAFGLVFSVLFGAGAGISSYPSVLAAWEYFPNAKGRVSGLLAACYGLSPSIYGIVFTFLANPDNQAPDVDMKNGEVKYKIFGLSVASRVQSASLTIAIIFACHFLAGILLSQTPKTHPVHGLKESIAASGSVLSHNKDTGDCPSFAFAVRTFAFWSLTTIMFSSLMFGLFLLNVYKNYGMLYFTNDHWMSVIGSISAVVSCVGRIGVAGAMDFVSFKLAFGLTMAVQLALAGTITLIVGNIYLYGAWVALSVTAFSGIFSSIGYESTKIFGPVMGSYVFAVIGQSLTLASLATILLNSAIGDRFGYSWSFHTCAFLSALALFLTLILPEHR